METSEQKHLPQARVVVPHPYLALMGLYLGGFAGMYSETALNIALPQLSAAFGVDLALTQWLVVGYMLVIGIVLPFTSLLAKWFSARKITLFALGAFLVGSVVSGLAPSFEICLVGRAIQGIGTGLVLPLMFSMVMEVIPPHKIGSAMGVNALVIMSASAIGPTLAGILVGALSWRAIFFSFAVVLLVGIAFTLKFSVSPYELTKPKIDGLSVLASCLGFGGIVLGAGISSLYGWASVPTIAALVIGIVALVVYVKRQLGMDVPVIDMRVFKQRGFTIGALCVMLNFGITLAIMFVLPQFYQNAMALPVSMAGLVLLPGGIVNAVVSALAGRVYDRVGARIPGMIGFGLSVAGSVALLFATPATPLAYVMACHITLMVGVPLAMSPCQTYALASLPHELSTDGSTMLNTMQQVLGAVCTALATFLLAAGQGAYLGAGGADVAEAFAQGSHLVFSFALVLAVVSLVLASRIKAQRSSATVAAVAKVESQGEASANAY
ncbi:MAG: DHA2 family efflux MFS transporter permease subunit [Eggerthellaceae bacterium]|nr:DHA2 family efflux MFS transporter permease subunit [Eggerthellaceae bacterium]